MADLAPPTVQVEDPGAHELAESSEEGDDHFSDASEGQSKRLSMPASPIPTTRVERVDDEPAYGEVPGTLAYKIRTQDAVPDEVEVVPDGQRSRSTSRLNDADRPLTPGGTPMPPIPKTVVELVDPDQPSHGEVPGTAAYEMRMADAAPDEVLEAPEETRQNLEGEPTSVHRSRSRSSSHGRSSSGRTLTQPAAPALEDYDDGQQNEQAQDDVAGYEHESAQGDDDDDGFGDDFDDFEQGGHEDDDFGDFDDGFEASEPEPLSEPAATPISVPDPLAHLPTLNFDNLNTTKDLLPSILPHLALIFPDTDLTALTTPFEGSIAPDPILSDRSASLWSQLVAPPPLQPPNWVRSRIRRLFLVSLGVPVDLDEILPASKQKKLILPSTHLSDSPRQSAQIARLKNEDGPSNSLASDPPKDRESRSKERRKKGGVGQRPGAPQEPAFDTNAASLLCSTTDAAMQGFEDDELHSHVANLEELNAKASTVLEFWLKRKDSAVGDKEAFEGVIENLVGFVKKSRR